MSSVIHTGFRSSPVRGAKVPALSQSPQSNERDFFFSNQSRFFCLHKHHMSLLAKVIGRFSSTRLLDLERILKLENIREKPTELQLRYIQNAATR
jgi:hypothetical protein